MEWILAKVGIEVVQYATGGIVAVVVAWILKKIPNNAIKARFGQLMYGLGITCTLGLAKWKWTKKLWNKTIEPWIIDAINNIVVHGISEFVRGMRSDNK